MKILVCGVALILCAGAARADSLGSLDIDGAAVRIGEADVGVLGLRGAWGPKWGPVYVQGEYAAFIAGWNAEPGTMVHDVSGRGLVQRAGVTVRWRVTSLEFDDHSGDIAFWLEAGAGRLMPGFAASTNDLIGGFGMQIHAHHRDGKPGKGFWFGARFIATPVHASSVRPITCDGPCDTASGPSSYGVGLMMLMGMSWGS